MITESLAWRLTAPLRRFARFSARASRRRREGAAPGAVLGRRLDSAMAGREP